jgi:hypothetical protein
VMNDPITVTDKEAAILRRIRQNREHPSQAVEAAIDASKDPDMKWGKGPDAAPPKEDWRVVTSASRKGYPQHTDGAIRGIQLVSSLSTDELAAALGDGTKQEVLRLKLGEKTNPSWLHSRIAEELYNRGEIDEEVLNRANENGAPTVAPPPSDECDHRWYYHDGARHCYGCPKTVEGAKPPPGGAKNEGGCTPYPPSDATTPSRHESLSGQQGPAGNVSAAHGGPPADAAPVAWRWLIEGETGDWRYSKRPPVAKRHIVVQPLYAHPEEE